MIQGTCINKSCFTEFKFPTFFGAMYFVISDNQTLEINFAFLKHFTKTQILKFSTLLFAPTGHLSHIWFAGAREYPPLCSIVGATVTVHQFFCILHPLFVDEILRAN